MTVSSGATLGGSGSIAGAVSIASGGFIAAGNSPGKLTLTGGLTIAPGGTLVAEINGTVAGTSYDQIDVTGTVTLTSAKLTLSLGYTPASSDSFILIANDGTDAIVGTAEELARRDDRRGRNRYVGHLHLQGQLSSAVPATT